MSDTEASPLFTRGVVEVQSATGPKLVDALTTPGVPGLALTAADFGQFEVTHVASGRRLSGQYERMGSALVAFAQIASIGAGHGIDFTQSYDAFRAALATCVTSGALVPFPGCTSTRAGVTTPMEIRTWFQVELTHKLGDEFPWESVEDMPDTKALALLEALPGVTLSKDADGAVVLHG